MVNGMALGDLWLVQERLGACHIHSLLYLDTSNQTYMMIYGLPTRALDDGTLGPGVVEYLAHTWAKVHHPGPYPGTHPSPPALCCCT